MIQIINGDCLEKMRELPENSVDSIVTDPPYELGFMGKSWDNTGIANSKEMWREAMRVLKPGGHLLAFSGTRTYHRMAVAIEDAGFEVRDMIEWVYGSGFPKSLNIGKSIENKMLTGNASKNGFHKLEGERREGRIGMYDTVEEQGFRKVNPDQLGAFDLEPTTDEAKQWEGWGTALKPAHEPICMARKPLVEKTVAENVLKYGTGGINIDESRVGTEGGTRKGGEIKPNIDPSSIDLGIGKVEDIGMGRFPANLIHDNSEEVRECFPETKTGNLNKVNTGIWGKCGERTEINHKGTEGNASRFFKSIIYQAKASKSERNKGCDGMPEKLGAECGVRTTEPGKAGGYGAPRANHHPTVKPISLMEYLIKMVTPEGGTVLDPFMGSGSTGVAAKENGYSFIGIDMTPEYVEIAQKRIESVV